MLKENPVERSRPAQGFVLTAARGAAHQFARRPHMGTSSGRKPVQCRECDTATRRQNQVVLKLSYFQNGVCRGIAWGLGPLRDSVGALPPCLFAYSQRAAPALSGALSSAARQRRTQSAPLDPKAGSQSAQAALGSPAHSRPPALGRLGWYSRAAAGAAGSDYSFAGTSAGLFILP